MDTYGLLLAVVPNIQTHNSLLIGKGSAVIMEDLFFFYWCLFSETMGPHGITMGPHGITMGPHGITMGPHGITMGPHGITMGPHGITNPMIYRDNKTLILQNCFIFLSEENT